MTAVVTVCPQCGTHNTGNNPCNGDHRTLVQLVREVLMVQDACNLSGVVHGWSRSMRRLSFLLPNMGTEERNRHPVNVLWADKVKHLTGDDVTAAYLWCETVV